MSWRGTLREVKAAERREQRDAQKRQRELERRNKELAKLSAAEQARLEVESYENRLEVLLSVHKSQGEIWDWMALASALPPQRPQKTIYNEIKARQNILVRIPNTPDESELLTTSAQSLDENVYREAQESFEADFAEWEKLKHLAMRILAGEHKAYIEALVTLSPLNEITDVGSLMHFTIESSKVVGCELKVNGTQAIPSDIKTLTVNDKVSSKPMPKARFHELYQDYISSCVLRVAREVFAILPVEILLLTASADLIDLGTGRKTEHPVLSVIISRKLASALNYESLEPTEAMDTFQYRSNFKATRKAGAFQPIAPFMAAELMTSSYADMTATDLLTQVQRTREEIQKQLTSLKSANKMDFI